MGVTLAFSFLAVRTRRPWLPAVAFGELGMTTTRANVVIANCVRRTNALNPLAANRTVDVLGAEICENCPL